MRILLSTLALLATPAWAEPPQVVADTPVTASLVGQVMGDGAPVQVLLPQGASAHHHQMRPSDARGLQDAGLLVWTGPELTPWLDRAAGSLADGVAQLRLLEVPGTHLRSYGEEQGHDHDHGGIDPHAWLDPANARLWLTAIAEVLAAEDPGNAETYARNAAQAGQRIADLDASLKAQLAPHTGASLVVFHDAYGYFTDHYGLRPAIAVSLGDASAPSAARLSAIRDRIGTAGAACAFPEYASDPKLVQTAIEGSGIRMGDALSPEGGTASPGPGLYFDLLSGMAQAIDGCLSR
ncbi:zinc ABC transporter substrate-binding protein [Paracoccus shandongensis]|uniref:zinc ABC transporter substrate-binding protein n=1 Tax=Paracoccus shandongensis TaxID=2816048 RepID=UPI001A8D45EE|nr:zinc ABC transporter substrate-binding protein [Paracoccus shandongensis]